MNRHVDTFIFDLDGTLLDTLPDLVVITNMALRKDGYPERSESEVLSYVGNGVKSLIRQAVPEGTDDAGAERVMSNWKELYPLYGSLLTKEFEGISALLKTLKAREMKLGVLSNKFNSGVELLIKEYFPGLFGVAYGEGEGIPRKPDPKGLLTAIKDLGSLPESTVYIGDSPTDIATARAAETFAVGVSWGYHHKADLQKAEADYVIDQPDQLTDLFK